METQSVKADLVKAALFTVAKKLICTVCHVFLSGVKL